jgi:predicted transcriptional regulator
LNEQESDKFLSFLLENGLLAREDESPEKGLQLIDNVEESKGVIYKTSEKGMKLLESYCELQY